MSIRKSFYTLSQDYFFPADPHFAEQGFVEFAGYDVQATAGRGEIGQGALRLQEAEQAVGGRCFLLHGRLRFVFRKNETALRKKQPAQGSKEGVRSEKNTNFNHLFSFSEHGCGIPAPKCDTQRISLNRAE